MREENKQSCPLLYADSQSQQGEGSAFPCDFPHSFMTVS